MEDLDCLGIVLLVKVGGRGGGGAERFKDVDGLGDAEDRKGSGMTTGSLEAGSSGARTLLMASNKVLPDMLISSWLLAASELVYIDSTFCQRRVWAFV